MTKIWEPESKFSKWLEIEILACEAIEKSGEIPQGTTKKIREKAKFDVARIDEIEKKTKHDVIDFLTNVAENVGEESRFIHLGMTSSDILDTCLALQLKEASELIIADIKDFLSVIEKKSFEHKNTVMIGGSHGIHAEPITFGLKMALWYSEMKRNLDRMQRAKENISYGMISGAVGTFAHIKPYVEEYVCEKLGLKSDPITTQVIQRDRHGEFMMTLAIIASSLDKFATELRHLQRTEVLEAEEFFTEGQKGSSAMPHKRNPITGENVTGLARMVRSYALPAMENVALWHERDISHSSAERMIGPDATVTLDFALSRLAGVIEKLVVYPENMRRNLDRLGGLVHSQRVLIALVDKGVTREDAYALVQRNAMKVWAGGGDFLTLLKADPEVSRALSAKELEALFDLAYHTKHVDTIFARVFGN